MSLTQENEMSMENLMDEVLKREITSRHSFFQLKYFVIGKEPTYQAKMWQCLRELKARKDSLTAIDFEIENTKDNIELLEIQIEEHNTILPPWNTENLQGADYSHPDDRKHAIKIRQLERHLKSTEHSLVQLEERKKWLLQEAQFFLEFYKSLEKVEALKDFDDLDAQKEYWGEKLSQKINLKMLMQSPLDIEMIETIIALPDDIPVKKQIVGRLNTMQDQLLQLKEEYRKKLDSRG